MVMLPRLEPSPHQVFDGIRARHAADMLAQQNPAAKAEEAAFANAWHFMLQVASTNSSSRHREVLIVAPGTKP